MIDIHRNKRFFQTIQIKVWNFVEESIFVEGSFNNGKPVQVTKREKSKANKDIKLWKLNKNIFNAVE